MSERINLVRNLTWVGKFIDVPRLWSLPVLQTHVAPFEVVFSSSPPPFQIESTLFDNYLPRS